MNKEPFDLVNHPCAECKKKDEEIVALLRELDDKDDEISEMEQDTEDEHGGGDLNED